MDAPEPHMSSRSRVAALAPLAATTLGCGSSAPPATTTQAASAPADPTQDPQGDPDMDGIANATDQAPVNACTVPS